MSDPRKQAVTGFKVIGFQVKKSKEGEVVKLQLEANVDQIGAGQGDMGDILKALLQHQVGEVDVGLNVFMSDDVLVSVEPSEDEE